MMKVKGEERFILDRSKNPSRLSATRKTDNIYNKGLIPAMKKEKNDKTWKIIERSRIVKKFVKTLLTQSWERYLSLLVHLFALIVLSWMIIDETNNFINKPTETAVDDDMYPIQNIDFPAIAICSINVLSRQKVFNLAGELWKSRKVREMENLTLERVQDLLKYMGHLYTFANAEDQPGDFKVLDKILSNAYGNNYLVSKIVEDMTPPCRKNFRHCSWSGEIRSCEELFIPRWTPDGLCCTFNYVRWTDGFSGEGSSDFSFEIEKPQCDGVQYGLRVFLNPYFDDIYYSTIPARGFKVLIFTATDYPDGPSGGMKEILVGPGSENFLEIKGTSFYSSPDVIRYDRKKRRCLFNTELYNDFDGTYSYSQCLMLCRARDIFKTCGCTPFFYPYPKDFASSRDCTVMDLECLHASKYRWWSIKPVLDDLENDWDKAEDFQNNLACDCLPTCETVDYAIYQTGSDIHHYDVGWVDFVGNCNNPNVSDDSILVNINFGLPTISRLRQDVLYYWYDLMSAYGGLCSIFLGLSILTPIEITFEFFRRLRNEKQKSNQMASADNFSRIVKPSIFKDPPMYWNEIIRSDKDIESWKRNSKKNYNVLAKR